MACTRLETTWTQRLDSMTKSTEHAGVGAALWSAPPMNSALGGHDNEHKARELAHEKYDDAAGSGIQSMQQGKPILCQKIVCMLWLWATLIHQFSQNSALNSPECRRVDISAVSDRPF
jgi:hypothetical protein